MPRSQSPNISKRIYCPYGPASNSDTYVDRWPNQYAGDLDSPKSCFLLVGPRQSGRTSTALAIARETQWAGEFRESPIRIDCQKISAEEAVKYLLANLPVAQSNVVTAVHGGEAGTTTPVLSAKITSEKSNSVESFKLNAILEAVADAILGAKSVVILDNVPLLDSRENNLRSLALSLCHYIQDKAVGNRRGRIIMTAEVDGHAFSFRHLGERPPGNIITVPIGVPRASGIKAFQDSAFKKHGVKFNPRIRSEIRRSTAGYPGLYHYLSDYGLEHWQTQGSCGASQNAADGAHKGESRNGEKRRQSSRFNNEHVVGYFNIWDCIGDSLFHSGVFDSYASLAHNLLWHYVRGDMHCRQRDRLRAAVLMAMLNSDGKAEFRQITKSVRRQCPAASRDRVVAEVEKLDFLIEVDCSRPRGGRVAKLRGYDEDRAEVLRLIRRVLELGEFTQYDLDIDIEGPEGVDLPTVKTTVPGGDYSRVGQADSLVPQTQMFSQ